MNPLFQMGHRALGPSIFEIGRPGGGAAPVPNWYDPIVAILNSGGATGYLWIHETGISEAVGQPVSSWEDTSGAAVWEQPGASSLRPIRAADGLTFDGIDDRLNGPAEVTGWIAQASGPYTMGVGVVTTLSNATSVYWGATNGGTGSIVNYTTQNVLGRAGGSTLFSTAVTDTGPLSSWVAVASGAANQAKRRVSAAETLGTYGAQTAGIINSTLGARRTTSASLFMNGRLAWAIARNAALSSADMLAIEDILVANGYPI